MVDSNEWKKLNRELKILRARKQSAGRLPPKDEQRLSFLEERLGDYGGEKRQTLSEEEDGGPKVRTSDDHYASEVSADLLKKAAAYQPTKAWEKDAKAPQRGFEAKDSRQGQATFRQKGLSAFAIDVSEDLKTGEVGLAETPQEETAAQKMDFHRVSYAAEDADKFVKKGAPKANPFAIELDDGLNRSLDKVRDFSNSAVPDSAAKVIQVDLSEEEEEKTLSAFDQPPPKPTEISRELEGMLRKSYDLPKDKGKTKSYGEATTHTVDETTAEELDLKLINQALAYAEDTKLVEKEPTAWAVDEKGRETRSQDESADVSASITAPGSPPPSAAPAKTRHRFSDSAPTRPGVATEADLEEASGATAAAPVSTEVKANPQFFDQASTQPGTTSDLGENLELELPEEIMSADDLVIRDEPAAAQGLDDVPTASSKKPSADMPDLHIPAAPPSKDYSSQVPDLSEEGSSIEIPLQVEPEPEAADPFPEENAAERQPAKPRDEMDAFWGLAGEPPRAQTSRDAGSKKTTAPQAKAPEIKIPEAYRINTPQPAPAPAPAPAPKPGSSRPLPALSFSGKPAAPAAPEPPKKARVLAPKSSDKGAEEGDFISNLFPTEGDKEDGLVPVTDDDQSAPEVAVKPSVRSPAPARTAKAPSTPRGANDLKGPRKVTVHSKDGVTRRGVLSKVDIDADTIRLEPPQGDAGQADNLNALALKTIFVILPHGTPYPLKQGMKARLVLIDGRSLQGTTSDYDPQKKAFTLLPTEDRGNIERIIVFNDAIKNIWFDES